MNALVDYPLSKVKLALCPDEPPKCLVPVALRVLHSRELGEGSTGAFRERAAPRLTSLTRRAARSEGPRSAMPGRLAALADRDGRWRSRAPELDRPRLRRFVGGGTHDLEGPCRGSVRHRELSGRVQGDARRGQHGADLQLSAACAVPRRSGRSIALPGRPDPVGRGDARILPLGGAAVHRARPAVVGGGALP